MMPLPKRPSNQKIPVLARQTVASKKSQLPASADAARGFFLLVNHSTSKIETCPPSRPIHSRDRRSSLAVSQIVCCALLSLPLLHAQAKPMAEQDHVRAELGVNP